MNKRIGLALTLLWISGAAFMLAGMNIYTTIRKEQATAKQELAQQDKVQREWDAFVSRQLDPRYLGDRWLDTWLADKSIIRLAYCVTRNEIVACEVRQDKI